MRLGADSTVQVEAIPTGSLALDLALGIGGVPRGRIVEIFGPESSGKTTLVYHIIAEAQARGGVCVFIDTEHAMDPIYANAIGVDTDELLVSQPDYGEQALQIADRLIASTAVDVVAIDSVAALTPKAELEGQIGDQTVGLQARLMSQAMRKLAGNLNRTNTVCVFTNQIREKVGVQFGSPETQPGGRALKFASSQRLDIRRIETLKEGTEAVGNRVRVKVVKNKVAAPFRQAEFDIEYGVGISREGGLLDFGMEHDLVQKSGSFFSYGETRLGQGRNNAKQFLADNPELAAEIEGKVRAALGLGAEAARGRARAEAAEAEPERRRETKAGLGAGRAALGARHRRPPRAVDRMRARTWPTTQSSTSAAALSPSSPSSPASSACARRGSRGGPRRWSSSPSWRWSASTTTYAVLNGQEEEEHRAHELEQANAEAEHLEEEPVERDRRRTARRAAEDEGRPRSRRRPAAQGCRRRPGRARCSSPPRQTEIAYDTTELEQQARRSHDRLHQPGGPRTRRGDRAGRQGDRRTRRRSREGKTSVSAELAPGAYTFFCTVPGHAEAGMEGTLTVK